MIPPAAIELSGLSKTFGENRVLHDVSFRIEPGTVVALVGENGSGKSTIVKTLAGLHRPDDSTRQAVSLNGTDPYTARFPPQAAGEAGLAVLHQDLGLIEDMTLADNVGLVLGFAVPAFGGLDRRRHQRRVTGVLERFGLGSEGATLVADLGPTERTLGALARAYALDVPDDRKIVVLDEPTAALSTDDSERLLAVIEQARRGGVTHILISHRLDEVERIADRALVLRDGRLVADLPRDRITVDALVAAMLGGEVRTSVRTAAGGPGPEGEELLRLSGIGGTHVHDVDAVFRAGEIVGLAGTVGSGKSELVRLLTGESRPRTGTIHLRGDAVVFRSPVDALRRGVAQVPQDRRGKGVLLDDTVRANLTLGVDAAAGSLAPRRRSRDDVVGTLITTLRIRPPDPDHVVGLLSGGNQQKVALGRVLALRPQILVLDEPTQGIDIGARAEIADILRQVAAAGTAVVIASSDTDELVDLCGRVLILRAGRLTGTLHAPFDRTDLSEAIAAPAVSLTTTEESA